MSPVTGIVDQAAGRFPRVSGDEPLIVSQATVFLGFSPRERG